MFEYFTNSSSTKRPEFGPGNQTPSLQVNRPVLYSVTYASRVEHIVRA